MSAQVAELTEWMKHDPAIRTMGRSVFASRNVRSLQQLEREHPEVLAELHEQAAFLREQAPPDEVTAW